MRRGFEWLPGFSLRRPVTISMILMAILVLGVVSYFRLSLELMPSGGHRMKIWLGAYYRHASASDILEQILDPVEKQLRTLPRLKTIESRASFEQARISLEFHRDTDLNQAYLQVREKLERLTPELPDDFDRFTVWRWDNRSRPIFWARLAYGGEQGMAPSHLVERIEQSLQRIPGVAKVDTYGGAGMEVAVLLDAEALESLRVDPFGVVDALRGNNFTLPLGRLETGGRSNIVRAVARLETLEDLRSLPVVMGVSRPGVPIPTQTRIAKKVLKIEDVARVALQEGERKSFSKFDGREAVLMAIYKETTANTVTVGKAVRRAIAEDFPTDPLLSGAQVKILFGNDQIITESLGNLQNTALWGGLFSFIILLVFMRRLAPTLLVMAAIPVSILMTLIAMFFLGASINIITMTGLMLALGMLVDNSVVVVENIARLRAQGAGAEEAARRGAGEVGLAIVMGTLTTMIVFLPLPFLGGRAFLTFLFHHLSYPIILSLAASLIVASLFVPLIAKSVLGRWNVGEPGWFEPFRDSYTRLLRRVLTRRMDAVIIFTLIFLTAWIPVTHLKWNLFGSTSIRRVRVNFVHSPVFDLEGIENYFDRLVERIDKKRGEMGIENILVHYRRSGGRMSLFIDPAREKSISRKKFFASLKKIIGEEPGVGYTIRGAGGEQKEKVLTITLLGPSPTRLIQLAKQVQTHLSGVEGLGELTFEEERPLHEVAVVIDRRLAEKQGVTAREVARSVAVALRGTSALPRFRLGEQEIEVVVRRDIGTAGFDALRSLRFKGHQGQVPFGTVARLLFRGAPERYNRIDGIISMSLEARLEGSDFQKTQGEINQVMSQMPFPDGYGWRKGHEGRELAEDRASLKFVLLLALGAIFMVMGILFESFLLPLTVLATIPLALFGSAWLIFLTETPLDTTGMVGMVILAGVVVNNGIVLVDRINQNRLSGLPLEEAIVQAGGVRLRPILVTALTTVGGLMPMVFGYTNVAGYSFVSMGRVVTGGLLTATALTLFIVPLTYHALARMEATIRNVAGRGVTIKAGEIPGN